MEQASRNPATDKLSDALIATAELLGKDPAATDAQALAILDAVPGQAQALSLLVSAMRLQGDLAGARALLESIVKTQPKLASAQYELGLLLGTLGETEGAIAALSRVVELEPNHPVAWRALGNHLAKAGRTAEANRAFARHFRTSLEELKLLEDAAAQGDDELQGAETMLREFLKIHPTDVTVIRMLAEIGTRLQHSEDAEKLLARALRLAPDFKIARHDYALVLQNGLMWPDAIVQADALLKDDPYHQTYLSLKALALAMTGEYDRAIECHEALIGKYPGSAHIWMNYGHMLRTVNRQQDSIAAYRKSIELLPSLGGAYWSLANLKTFRFSPAEIEAMQAQLKRADLSDDDRLHLHFSLGKALEDAKDYAPSFQHYAQGNAIRRAGSRYSAEDTNEYVHQAKALFTADFFRARAGLGCPLPDPIFVVGLPRSGSTLLEQILSSHSAIEGTMELPDIVSIARRLEDKRVNIADTHYPEILGKIDARELRALGEEYIARTRIHRKIGRPLFIDKAPHNFKHIGLIHLILPNAKIIDARRHPLGACFSNFKQHFARGQNFAYDLTELGRYYHDYVELMAHYDAVLPGRVYHSFYEQMVADPESETRRLLEYCGLPFEDACLRFYETDRAVRTVSSEQVRQPIYTQAVEQWRHYEPWLDPLKKALGSVLDAYPGVPAF